MGCKYFKTVSLPLLLIIFWATTAYANGTLQGYVSDPDGVNITGAQITGPSGSTVTDAEGFFSLSHPEGTYSFTASASGFVSKTVDNITISDGAITNLDFTLSEMVVTGNYPSLGTLGSNLPIEIKGGGFDGSTRLALLPDSGNAFNEVGQFADVDLFQANAVKKIGNTVYLVDLAGGRDNIFTTGMLYIVDVTNPTDPKELGSVSLPGNGRSIDVSGSYAYITYGDTDTGEGGLIVVDISNSASPQLKGSVQLNVAYDVAVQGSTAYVVDGNCMDVGPYTKGGKLHAINVSSPNSPSKSWSLGLTSFIPDTHPSE